MTTIQIIEKLVELQEARRAAGKIFDERCCDLILELSLTYVKEQAILQRSFGWLVREVKARCDKEQGVPTGKGSYSPELKIALKLLNGR